MRCIAMELKTPLDYDRLALATIARFNGREECERRERERNAAQYREQRRNEVHYGDGYASGAAIGFLIGLFGLGVYLLLTVH
jgi:hypothetical protein